VTGDDVPHRDMPIFTWPGRRDVPFRRDVPLISDAALAALLAGAELPAGAAPQLRPLAQALTELAGGPAEDELAGEADIMTTFRDYFGTSGPAQVAGRSHRLPSRRRPLPLKAAAVVATILGLGGVATAAYAGALPAGLQRLAHDIIGAPAVGARPATRPSPAVPAATGQPGYGLCTAWARAKAHGTRKQRAAVFHELAANAGGPGNVTAYCAAMAHTATPSSRPAPTPSHHSAKPAVLPTPRESGKPTALPTPRDSGKPTALPTPRGSGKPTALPTQHNPGGTTVYLTQLSARRS
jgi:hypothetical protein